MNLLPESEVEDATVQVVHPQVCQFETERFVLQVTTDRFVAATKPNATPEPLRDLVLGTFYILEHTPATALGINRQMHFPLGSEEAWHRLGDRLAPKAGWNDVLPGRPGMRTLEIHSFKDETKGPAILVRVQPSAKVQFGVYFEVNDHHPAPASNGLRDLLTILQHEWEAANEHAIRVVRHILDWASERDD
jgi:hypothetical protein